MKQRKRREHSDGVGYFTNWERNRQCGCIYCGNPANTREHVPSRTLLVEPFPENLPTIPACFDCNNGYSADEEYLICYLEVLKSKVCYEYSISEHINNILAQKQSLYHLIDSQIINDNGCICPAFDTDRFSRIITKLAIGHVGYEFDDLNFDGSNSIWYDFSTNINDDKKDEFKSIKLLDIIPEISSRFSCNVCINQNVENGDSFVVSDWICVQNHRYSYNVTLNEFGGVSVKIIILDFLFCQIDFE